MGEIKNGGGDWIWTSDLWVMSPTSCRTALPRDSAVYAIIMPIVNLFIPLGDIYKITLMLK